MLREPCLLANIRNKKIVHFGHIIRHSIFQHALLYFKENRRQANNDVDEEHNRLIRVGLCRKEGTQELVARKLIASDPAMDGT